MQGKLYHCSRMWSVEVEIQVSLDLAIYDMETLLVASSSTLEYQQNIK
jgi:hypothetical protein